MTKLHIHHLYKHFIKRLDDTLFDEEAKDAIFQIFRKSVEWSILFHKFQDNKYLKKEAEADNQ